MTYRRPSLRSLILSATVATAASLLIAFSRPADMIVDGQAVPSDVPPVTTANNVFVPIRTLGDALGAQMHVDGDEIQIVRGSQSLRVRIGSTHASIDGRPFPLARAPFRVRGRVMVGLRAVARAFGVYASYNARTAQIQIITPGVGEASQVTPPQAQ